MYNICTDTKNKRPPTSTRRPIYFRNWAGEQFILTSSFFRIGGVRRCLQPPSVRIEEISFHSDSFCKFDHCVSKYPLLADSRMQGILLIQVVSTFSQALLS